MDEEGVEFVGGSVYLPVGFLYLFVYFGYSGLVLLYPLTHFIFVLFQELHKLRFYIFAEVREDDGVVNFISFDGFGLADEELLGFREHGKQIELILSIFVDHFQSLEKFSFFLSETPD